MPRVVGGKKGRSVPNPDPEQDPNPKQAPHRVGLQEVLDVASEEAEEVEEDTRRSSRRHTEAAEEAAVESARELADIIKWLAKEPIQTINLHNLIYMQQSAGQPRAFSDEKMNEQYRHIQELPPSMPLSFAVRENNGVYLR